MCATANISEYQMVNKFGTGVLLKTFVLTNIQRNKELLDVAHSVPV